MSAKSIVRITLALALALTGACGEDPIDTGNNTGGAGADDDDEGATPDDDADDDVPPGPDDDSDDDADDDIPTPPPPKPDAGSPTVMRDGGGPSTGGRDSGVDAAGRDTGSPTTTGDGGGQVTPPGDAGDAPIGKGECCPDGKCICRSAPPSSPSNMRGPHTVMNYAVSGAGCVYYPTNAEPPFAAVAVSDGFGGSGGCGRTQTDQWGPLYASWGIVTMIVNTGSGDQPAQRGSALNRGIAAFKAENTRSGSPLMGKMAGRYGTSGFSMGGGGTSYATVTDKTLLSSIAIMPWGPSRGALTTPTLVICGSSDTIASCTSHGTPLYNGIMGSVPKMRITVQSGHAGQPSAGGGNSGKAGLVWQKVYLEGDTRWKPLLKMIMANGSANVD